MSNPNSNAQAESAEPDSNGELSAVIKPKHRRKLSVRVAALSRWLHIYLSMFALFVLLFFSVTGVTLNHPEWFAEAAKTSELEGKLESRWVKPPQSTATQSGSSPDPGLSVAKLEVVEYLRNSHAIRGAVADFMTDDRECVVVFKGPGHSADAFIDRETGKYRLTRTSHGLIAIINDLHKGRDTGTAWSIVIDASAILMILASLTGLILLFYIKRRRVSGVVTAIVGTLIVVVIVYFLVP